MYTLDLVPTQVNVYEAKSQLSALLYRVETGEDIVIARNGRPVARLVRFDALPTRREPGAWRGQVRIAEDFDELGEADLQEWYGQLIEPA